MADHIPGIPPRRQRFLPLSTFLSSENPVKTEEYGSSATAVVPANHKVQSMAAFTLLTFTQDPFKLKKRLTKSDVGGSSRLLLQRDWVEQHILPLMNQHDAQLCRTIGGKHFIVLDVNDDSLHHLTLKKWKNSYFVFTGNWVPNFVTRKNLEAGDVVGMAFCNGSFFFKLFKKKGN